MFPTKIGVAFPPGRFKQLVKSIEEIDESIKSLCQGRMVEFKTHLGGGWYACISSGFYFINLRKYWVPPGASQEVPTKNGIALRLAEWLKMKSAIPTLYRNNPDLANVEPCNMNFTHQNVIAYLDCPECCPFKNN